MKKNRDICDSCYEEQNKLAEDICNYVLSLDKDSVSMAHIMEKFNISSKEFETFFNNAKFVQINAFVADVNLNLEEKQGLFVIIV